MIDREMFRGSSDILRQSLRRRGEDEKLLTQVNEADEAWRKLLSKSEPLKAAKNKLSRQKPTPAQLKEAKKLSGELSKLETEAAAAEQKFYKLWAALPNLVAEDVPDGSEVKVIKTVGTPRIKDGKSHHELMTRMGWLDLKTAAEYSGSRFRYLLGQGAALHLELINQAIKLAVKNGFELVIPPVLTREKTLEKAGFFPLAKDDIFAVERDQLYLTGTSEQTLLALSADKTFEARDLPKRFVGFSSCFRREVGSYGKDVEGMFRTHQFDKVEMISITTPDQSVAEHQFLVEMQERLVKTFGLAYQLVITGAADLGPTAYRKVDLETWFPGQKRYRETHSASNCTDYQARRFNTKVRRQGKTELAHTLNATLTTERLLLGFIENHQRPDGSVALPWRYRS